MSLVLHGSDGITFPDGGEIAIADLKDGTDGELITWNASAVPAAVAVGTSGHVLTSGGAGVAPTFAAASAGLTLIESFVPTAASEIEFDTGINDDSMYCLTVAGVSPATAAVFYIRTSNSGTADSGGSDYKGVSTNQLDGVEALYESGSIAQMRPTDDTILAAGVLNAVFWFGDPASTKYTMFSGIGSYHTGGNGLASTASFRFMGNRIEAAAITEVYVGFEGDVNFTAEGRVSLYKYAAS
jgi:hypothetical protein